MEDEELSVGEYGASCKARGIKYMEGQGVTLNRDEEVGQM